MKEYDEAIVKPDFEPKNHSKNLIRSLLHAADLSNPTRPTEVSKFWSFAVLDEFFN